jgi:hypothetical protein
VGQRWDNGRKWGTFNYGTERIQRRFIVTVEYFVSPMASDGFDKATIPPFSHFPGCKRTTQIVKVHIGELGSLNRPVKSMRNVQHRLFRNHEKNMLVNIHHFARALA